jgi:hypothetical protein
VISRFFLATSLLFVAAGAVFAQTPFSGEMQCTPPSPSYSVDIPDTEGHSAILQQTTCAWTQQVQIGPTKTAQSVATLSADVMRTKLTGNGVNVITMGNGDRVVIVFHTVIAASNKLPQSAEGTFTITGGTGQMGGISGKGTFTGLFNTDGSATYRLQGEFALPKPAGQ